MVTLAGSTTQPGCERPDLWLLFRSLIRRRVCFSSIINLYHPQSGEMSPQELGAFCMVSIRPYGSKPSDDDDTIRLPDGRVMEHHVVIFDYNAGGGERAINSQASATTEACLSVIMIEEDNQGLDIKGACGGRWGLNSDNCCSDLKCADHLGALDTWVNPSPARSPQSVLKMKKSLAITDLPRFWGAAKHGKWLIDAVRRLRHVPFAQSGCLTVRTAAVAAARNLSPRGGRPPQSQLDPRRGRAAGQDRGRGAAGGAHEEGADGQGQAEAAAARGAHRQRIGRCRAEGQLGQLLPPDRGVPGAAKRFFLSVVF